MLLHLVSLLAINCDIGNGNIFINESHIACWDSTGSSLTGTDLSDVRITGSTTDFTIRVDKSAPQLFIDNINITLNFTSPFIATESNVTMHLTGHNVFRHTAGLLDKTPQCTEDWFTCHYADGIACRADSTVILRSDTNARLEAKSTKDSGIGVGGYKTLCKLIEIDGLDVDAAGYGGAGIGSGYYGSLEKLVISNSTVRAFSKFYGAGIGSGSRSNIGSVAITNSLVEATGYIGAGIGGSLFGNATAVSISESVVNATGLDAGAGIGGGYMGGLENLTIVKSVVNANSKQYGTAIGAGHEHRSGVKSITISESQVWAIGSPFTHGIGHGLNDDVGTLRISDSYVFAKGKHGQTVINGAEEETTGRAGGIVVTQRL